MGHDSHITGVLRALRAHVLPVALPRDVRGGSGSGRPRCGASARPPFVRSLPQVAQQIRAAQQKAALAGQAPPAWAIGARCQAVYSLDGEWYEAAVVGVTTAGDFVVKFAAYNNTEQVLRRARRGSASARTGGVCGLHRHCKLVPSSSRLSCLP